MSATGPLGSPPFRQRRGSIRHPGPLLALLIATCAGMGYAIYSLIRGAVE